jgi:hypothetical protein
MKYRGLGLLSLNAFVLAAGAMNTKARLTYLGDDWRSSSNLARSRCGWLFGETRSSASLRDSNWATSCRVGP